MRTIGAQLKLIYHAGDAELQLVDCDSGVLIAVVSLSSSELLALLASTPVETDAQLATEDRLARVGKKRVHEEHIPDPTKLALPDYTHTGPTDDMVIYGDFVRREGGWASATWLQHSDGEWCLHLMKWV